MTTDFSPMPGRIQPRFSGIKTFLRLPHHESPQDVDAMVVGVPYDALASYRPGARFGPRAVREMSSLLRPYNRVLEIDPYTILNCADVGDCPVNPFNTMESLDLMAKRYEEIARPGVFPLSFGGDQRI